MRWPAIAIAASAALVVLALSAAGYVASDRMFGADRETLARVHRGALPHSAATFIAYVRSLFAHQIGDEDDVRALLDRPLDPEHLGYLSNEQVGAMLGEDFVPPDIDQLPSPPPPPPLPPMEDFRVHLPPKAAPDVNGDRPPRDVDL